MKKRIMLRTLAGACAAMLCLSACSGGEERAEGENKTLTYWVALDSTLATHVSSYNEVSMYKKLEEESGIHIEFIHPAVGQENEQFNLLITSGNMPDMVEYKWADYKGGAQKAIDDGIIIALNDYLEQCPNFQKALTDSELADIYFKNSVTDSGAYYGFTALNVGNYRIFGGPCIRRDLLEQYQLEMPQTIDDWTRVLTVFKNNGIQSPLTGMLYTLYSSTSNLNFAGAYGVSGGWYLDGDTVKYGPMEDGFKDYVTQLNQWYSNGLIDRDVATNTQTLVDSKIVNGDSVALINGFLGSALGRYLPQKQAEDPSWDLTGTPYPVLNAGEVNAYPNMEGDVNKNRAIAITTACKSPEIAAAWCDQLYSQEGYMLSNFGIEGEDYNLVDDKPVYTDKILHNPDGLSVNEALLLSCRATSAAPGFNQAPEYLEQYYQYEQQRESFQMWEANTQPGRATMLPILFPTIEESEIINTISADMNIYVSEQIWNFVVGATPLDQYDTFRETLRNQFRFDEYSKIMQDQYDRYKNR